MVNTSSTEEFSVGKEAANFATAFVKNNLREIVDLLGDTSSAASSSIRVRLKSSYKSYLACVGERYSKVKTFLLNQEAVELTSFYVPMGVNLDGTVYPDASIESLTAANNFNVITGTAGSGKSMLMRYLFLDSIRSKHKIPVFIELRDFNGIESSLKDEVVRQMTKNKFDLGNQFIEKAFDRGHFLLFLDGFDELAENKRNKITKEILAVAAETDGNQIVVSSRPDHLFNQWREFRVWEISNLTLSKATALIKNLPHDNDLKEKFVQKLIGGLFAEHEYFLSNPLLLTIMWLCYEENAEIPTKYNLFYERAYEALFNKHDARKGGFQRSRRTKLNIKEFSDVFSAVAIQSFDSNQLEFSETEAIEYIENARTLVGGDFNSTDFLYDSVHGVCLLLEDGLRHTFAHRSFQEYFTAVFILRRNQQSKERLLKRFFDDRPGTDNVLELALSMDSEAVSSFIIIPEIERIEGKLNYKGGRLTQAVIKKLLMQEVSQVYVGPVSRSSGSDLKEHLYFVPKYSKFSTLRRLLWACPALKGLNDELSTLGYDEEPDLIALVKTRIADPYTPVPIKTFVGDREIFSKFARQGGFGARFVKHIFESRKELQKELNNRRDSLKSLLGI